MTVPTSSLYPSEYDGDENLFVVRDSLRMRLLDDYSPGDTSILVEGEEGMMDRFPSSGVITLTEQCSEIDLRAVSMYYSSRTSDSFDGLEVLEEFKNLNSFKPRRITNVTMNVMAMHHNHLKDSLMAVQSFLGTKYSSDANSLTGRIKRLERLVFRPKVWFSADTTMGLAPLEVRFENKSFRLGFGRVKQTWDFGDGDPLVIETDGMEEYSSLKSTVDGVEIEGSAVRKVYSSPGIYDVSLVVENEWGADSVEFKGMIVVKTESPETAIIEFINRPSQSYTEGDWGLGAPPRLRSVANSFVDLEVPRGENPFRPGYSSSGEILDSSGSPVDPIVEYTWSLGDELPHSNSQIARASYSRGGKYDIVLRVDTSFGSYRITKYESAIDIVESKNLWMFNFEESSLSENSSGPVRAYEFGLLSETFKLLGRQSLFVERNNGFLDIYGSENYKSTTIGRARSEFFRNSEFAQSGTSTSGNKGNSILFWAGGGQSSDSKEIVAKKYNAFDDHYESLATVANRPWNWVALTSPEKSYFLFGDSGDILPNQNRSFAFRTDYDLSVGSASLNTPMGPSQFENGADDLLDHPSHFDQATGLATNGYFATYRSTWKDSSGYILRNSSVNEFFRMSSFYRTNGSLASPFNTLTKLPDIVGSVKVEGELVSMSNGVFFFNNSGEICAWNDRSLTWEVGRAGSSALTFRSVQDTRVSSFDDRSNTLLASSDGDRMAYLSYDYSDRAFVKFNGVDLTFSTTRYRPPGRQFNMGVY
jgi:PKD repeat protein